MTKKKKNVNNQLKFNFLTNSVKGLQSSEKRVKIFEYFNNKIGHRGTLFLQETNSSVDIEKQCNDDLSFNYISLMVESIHAVFLLYFTVR